MTSPVWLIIFMISFEEVFYIYIRSEYLCAYVYYCMFFLLTSQRLEKIVDINNDLTTK